MVYLLVIPTGYTYWLINVNLPKMPIRKTPSTHINPHPETEEKSLPGFGLQATREGVTEMIKRCAEHLDDPEVAQLMDSVNANLGCSITRKKQGRVGWALGIFGTSKMRSKPTDIWRFNRRKIGFFNMLQPPKSCRSNTPTIFRKRPLGWRRIRTDGKPWGSWLKKMNKIKFQDVIGMIWSIFQNCVFSFHLFHEVKTRVLFSHKFVNGHPSINRDLYNYPLWYEVDIDGWQYLIYELLCFDHCTKLICANRTWWFKWQGKGSSHWATWASKHIKTIQNFILSQSFPKYMDGWWWLIRFTIITSITSIDGWWCFTKILPSWYNVINVEKPKSSHQTATVSSQETGHVLRRLRALPQDLQGPLRPGEICELIIKWLSMIMIESYIYIYTSGCSLSNLFYLLAFFQK